jgi:hypothetical protein
LLKEPGARHQQSDPPILRSTDPSKFPHARAMSGFVRERSTPGIRGDDLNQTSTSASAAVTASRNKRGAREPAYRACDVRHIRRSRDGGKRANSINHEGAA